MNRTQEDLGPSLYDLYGDALAQELGPGGHDGGHQPIAKGQLSHSGDLIKNL